jgi:hypothetical protein
MLNLISQHASTEYDARPGITLLARLCGACLAAFDCFLYFQLMASRYALLVACVMALEEQHG